MWRHSRLWSCHHTLCAAHSPSYGSSAIHPVRARRAPIRGHAGKGTRWPNHDTGMGTRCTAVAGLLHAQTLLCVHNDGIELLPVQANARSPISNASAITAVTPHDTTAYQLLSKHTQPPLRVWLYLKRSDVVSTSTSVLRHSGSRPAQPQQACTCSTKVMPASSTAE